MYNERDSLTSLHKNIPKRVDMPSKSIINPQMTPDIIDLSLESMKLKFAAFMQI